MFEACMLFAFLCAGLCHLLPPQPPAASDQDAPKGGRKPPTAHPATRRTSQPLHLGHQPHLGGAIPAYRRFQ